VVVFGGKLHRHQWTLALPSIDVEIDRLCKALNMGTRTGVGAKSMNPLGPGPGILVCVYSNGLLKRAIHTI